MAIQSSFTKQDLMISLQRNIVSFVNLEHRPWMPQYAKFLHSCMNQNRTLRPYLCSRINSPGILSSFLIIQNSKEHEKTTSPPHPVVHFSSRLFPNRTLRHRRKRIHDLWSNRSI